MQGPKPPRPRPARALTDTETTTIIDVLTSERFCDQATAQVWAELLDEGTYLASVSTMYRLLRQRSMVRERRRQARRPAHIKPELVATTPNQVWSWDITKLRGATRGTSLHLYVVIDVFSRYVVGWMVAQTESQMLARELFHGIYERERVKPGQVTVHADRGAAMTSRGLADLFVTLGIEKSHSRPSVSDDNPYSEAQFKTFKYRPGFPDRFGSIEDARSFCQGFFDWYNFDHRHSGIAMLTPDAVHHGRVEAKDAIRLAHVELSLRADAPTVRPLQLRQHQVHHRLLPRASAQAQAKHPAEAVALGASVDDPEDVVAGRVLHDGARPEARPGGIDDWVGGVRHDAHAGARQRLEREAGKATAVSSVVGLIGAHGADVRWRSRRQRRLTRRRGSSACRRAAAGAGGRPGRGWVGLLRPGVQPAARRPDQRQAHGEGELACTANRLGEVADRHARQRARATPRGRAGGLAIDAPRRAAYVEITR